jgi:hypothetical protein
MRKIVSYLFITLDGVVESPERWVMYNNEMGTAINEMGDASHTLLLGRRTYDTFAASWPQRTNEDDPLADWMNNTAKVVVSSTLQDPTWNNTTAITSDVDKQVRLLKEQVATTSSSAAVPLWFDHFSTTNCSTSYDSSCTPSSRGQVSDSSATPAHPSKLADSKSLDNGVSYTKYRPVDD